MHLAQAKLIFDPFLGSKLPFLIAEILNLADYPGGHKPRLGR
jgi:hypothetical protein